MVRCKRIFVTLVSGDLEAPMSSQLVEFLEGRKAKAHEIDWVQKKRDWIDAVGLLYSKIGQLLGPSIENGTVKTEKVDIELNEEFIGMYSTNELRVDRW